MRTETCPHCGKHGGLELWTGFDSFQREVFLPWLSYDWIQTAPVMNPSVLCSKECRMTIGHRAVHEFSVCRNCGETAT